MKWNESGFRPPLCRYRLNWARRTSWGWWNDWDDTVLQTQDSKFEPWRSEAEHATSRSRKLPTILTFTRGWGRNIFCFFQTAETGNRTLVWKAVVLTTTLGPPPTGGNTPGKHSSTDYRSDSLWQAVITKTSSAMVTLIKEEAQPSAACSAISSSAVSVSNTGNFANIILKKMIKPVDIRMFQAYVFI